MARFVVNDRVEFLKRNEVIRKGIVVAGPWNVEKVDHYHVKWEWDIDGMIGKQPDLICDLSSEKYRYRLSN